MISYFSLLFFMISWHLLAAHTPEQQVTREVSYERRDQRMSFFTMYCDGPKCVRRVKETGPNGSPKTVRFEMLRRIIPGSPRPYRSERNQNKIEQRFKELEALHVKQNSDGDQ